jgi:hypothetical protein
VRRHRLLNILAAVTVISTGLITLIGLLSDSDSVAGVVAQFTLQITSVIAAVAVLVGILNLLGVHLGRLGRTDHGWPYSLVVVLSMAGVIALRVLDRLDIWSGDL